MLRKRYEYDAHLENFSSAIMPFIDYRMNSEGFLEVAGETADFYRFPDMTGFAEYIYDCVKETFEVDLEEEIGFLQMFDEALEKIGEIVDMPDRKASLMVRLLMQNKGTLSKNKREKFPEITDEELLLIEKSFNRISD
jgi:hypothetical protein